MLEEEVSIPAHAPTHTQKHTHTQNTTPHTHTRTPMANSHLGSLRDRLSARHLAQLELLDLTVAEEGH